MELNEIETTLAGCELFKGLTHQDIQRIAKVCRVKSYEAGEFVYQQGDFGEHLHIIADGKVVLERTMNIGSREGRVIIAILGKGRVFGCWSTLLNDSHFMMLATFCKTPSTILELKGNDIRRLMIEDTAFGFNVMEKLCFLLRERIQAAYGALERI
jgi:CRP-like cAMP-binding protein